MALSIDDTLAEAHASLAHVKHRYSWDYGGAEAEFKRAIELNPAYPPAHQWYANLLNYTGRREEAIEEARLSQRLDPLSLIINSVLGFNYYFARRYDEAIVACEKTLEELKGLSRQSYVSAYHLAFLYHGLGDKDRALDYLERAYEERSSSMIALKVDRVFESLHTELRFQNLLRRVGLQ